VFWGVVHVDPIDQVFLDPVSAEVGVLLLDVRNRLLEIEPLSVGPNKFALLGVELHVLHQITERVRELGKLLALRRMSPFEEVVEEGIVRENTVFQVVRTLFAPVAHGVDLLNRRTSIASSRDRVTDIAVKAAKRLQVAISRQNRDARSILLRFFLSRS
jgi:hypothetical protein